MNAILFLLYNQTISAKVYGQERNSSDFLLRS